MRTATVPSGTPIRSKGMDECRHRLNLLDLRLGLGAGAKRERDALNARIKEIEAERKGRKE